MGRRTLISIGYLILVLVLTGTMLSDVLWDGEPLTRSQGFSVAIFFASAIPMRLVRIWQGLRHKSASNLADANATVTLRETAVERICTILIGLGMTAMGALPLLGFPGPGVPTVLLVVIVVMGGYLTIACIIRGRAVLTVSPAGLDWNHIKPSFVPWSDVIDSRTRHSFGIGTLVVLELKEAGTYFPKGMLKRSCKRFGITPASLGVDAEALVRGIEAHRMPDAFYSPR
jgi:hypothetical protein